MSFITLLGPYPVRLGTKQSGKGKMAFSAYSFSVSVMFGVHMACL